MLKLSAVLLCILIPTTISVKMSDHVIIKDVAEFLHPDGSLLRQLTSPAESSDNKTRCVKDERVPLSQGSYDIDTENQDCGWEVASVTITCGMFAVTDIGFKLRNVADPALTKNVNQPIRIISKALRVPLGVHITRIEVGYNVNFMSSSVSSVVFKLSNGRELDFTCKRPRKVRRIELSAFERTTGFYGLTRYGSITDLFFYKNRVTATSDDDATVEEGAPAYADIVNQINGEAGTHGVKDRFYQIGLTGAKHGKFFVDPYFYGHWKIKKINLATSKHGITGLQSVLTNTFFDYEMKTEVHGVDTLDSAGSATIDVPLELDIRALEVVVQGFRTIVGLRLHYSDDSSSDYIGQNPFKIGHWPKFIEIKPGQELMGFYGWADDTSINALGVLVVQKNGDQRFYQAN